MVADASSEFPRDTWSSASRRAKSCALVALALLLSAGWVHAQRTQPCRVWVDSSACMFDAGESLVEAYTRATRWYSAERRREDNAMREASKSLANLLRVADRARVDSIYRSALTELRRRYTDTELCRYARLDVAKSHFRSTRAGSNELRLTIALADTAHCYDPRNTRRSLTVTVRITETQVFARSSAWEAPHSYTVDSVALEQRLRRERLIDAAFDEPIPAALIVHRRLDQVTEGCESCADAPNVAAAPREGGSVSTRTDSTFGLLGLLGAVGQPDVLIAEVCEQRRAVAAASPGDERHVYSVHNVLQGALPPGVDYVLQTPDESISGAHDYFARCGLLAFELQRIDPSDRSDMRRIRPVRSFVPLNRGNNYRSPLATYFAPILEQLDGAQAIVRLRDTPPPEFGWVGNFTRGEHVNAHVNFTAAGGARHAGLLGLTARVHYDTAQLGTRPARAGIVRGQAQTGRGATHTTALHAAYDISVVDLAPGVLEYRLRLRDTSSMMALPPGARQGQLVGQLSISLPSFRPGHRLALECDSVVTELLTLTSAGLKVQQLRRPMTSVQFDVKVRANAVGAELDSISSTLHVPGARLTVKGAGLGYRDRSVVWMPCRFPDSLDVPLYGHCNVQPWHATGTGLDWGAYEGPVLTWKVPDTYSFGLDGRRGLAPASGEVYIGRWRPSGIEVSAPARKED